MEKILTLHKQLLVARTPDEQTGPNVPRSREATDCPIDALVYELYELKGM